MTDHAAIEEVIADVEDAIARCEKAGIDGDGLKANRTILRALKSQLGAGKVVAWDDWRRSLAEFVDAYIQAESDGEGDDEAYAELKGHILKTPFAAPPPPPCPEWLAELERLAEKATKDWTISKFGVIVGGEHVEKLNGKVQAQIACFQGSENVMSEERDANCALAVFLRNHVDDILAVARGGTKE